jgi:hypothetical protein
MMLLRPDGELEKVCFQARRLGWQTDDLLLEGTSRAGQRLRVALQIKSTFYLREDEESRKTLCGMWDDFANSELFEEAGDRLGLIIGKTNQKLGKGLRLLVDTARACSSAADFYGRLALAKYLAAEAKGCLDALRKILKCHAGAAMTEEAIWRFVSVLDFAVLDFDSSTSVAEGLVKSLLVGTCHGPSSLGQDTWNELLRLAADAAPAAREMRWRDLPDELRQRHRSSSSPEREALDTLEKITQVIVDGAEAQIGGRVALPRGEIVGALLEAMTANAAVIVTGEAGGGKTVIARSAFAALRLGCLGIAFRAESLTTSHIAASLQGLGGNLRDVLRLFALHPQKVLWIESAERLLEKEAGEREAFMDLLRIFTQAGGWKLLITCRDYSVETFRSSFLTRAGVMSQVISVPPLTEEELQEVRRQLPELEAPLGVAVIRQIVRNPFYLDLAARMAWPAKLPMPANVRAFREKAWREVVCRQNEAADGLPLKRDRTMVEVALRRARALTPYVTAEGLPEEALQKLQQSSVLVADPEDHTRFAPAHDVYEDWALLQWLQRAYEQGRALNAVFFARVESHPAMRRAFRRWLTELLECEPAEADRRMDEVLRDTEVAQHWKDDALVAVLQSVEAGAFLTRSGATLLAGDAALLRRAVHLLRVACRIAPLGATAYSSIGLQAEGPAWNVMPHVVARGLAQLKRADIQWILPLLEECVSKGDLQMEAQIAIGSLARTLFASLEGFGRQSKRLLRQRVLRLMLRVPHTLEAELRKMLDEALSESRLDWEEGTLSKLIWDHFSGAEVCRRFPNMTLQVAERRLGFTHAPDRERTRSLRRSYHRPEVNEIFGAHVGSFMDDYPASAWQGPFANLLAHHPHRGVDLIVRLVNYACAAYAHFDQDTIEKPKLVILQLEAGGQVSQWANWRLWVMYRAMNVATHTLESALMALEEWLLQKAARGDEDTPVVFARLLSDSNNIAITAVLASVATAHPYLFDSTALPLLTCKELFVWDFDRAFQEAAARSGTARFSQLTLPENLIFEHERDQSARREHRPLSLEQLCLHLQFTPAREKVWMILDRYLAALPPLEQQNDGHRVWRIRLHGMDARHFEKRQSAEHGVIWQATGLAEDLQEFQRSHQPVDRDRELRIGLALWGIKVFSGEERTTQRPELWREQLSTLRALPPVEAESPLLRGYGAAHIAAVCLREHTEELSPEEREWCSDVICTEIETPPIDVMWQHGSVSLMDPLAPCAMIIPLLATRETEEARRTRFVRCLAAVVLHPKAEVVQFAALGIGRFLLPANRALALGCVAAAVAHVLEMAAFRVRQRTVTWNEREQEEDAFQELLLERLHTSILAGLVLDESEITRVDYRRHPGLQLLLPLLLLFGEQPVDPLTCAFYEHVATVLVASWAAEGHMRGLGDEEDERRDDLRYQVRYQVHQVLARFALTGPEDSVKKMRATLVAASVDRPKEAAEFFKCICYAEDSFNTGERFWAHWQAFADLYLARSLETHADNEGDGTVELLDALLLRIDWKAETREWQTLRGQRERILAFVDRLPPSARSIEGLALLVNRFAGEFLPGAIPLLARHLYRTYGNVLLSGVALPQLEDAIGGLVYSGAVAVRREQVLREATMAILDSMVEAGSSKAFRIRDDFVTPLRK